MEAVMESIDYLSSIFILAIGTLPLLIAVLFILDTCQPRHALRRNYPVIGRFRHVLSPLGEFLRQYFFAMDREEWPSGSNDRARGRRDRLVLDIQFYQVVVIGRA